MLAAVDGAESAESLDLESTVSESEESEDLVSRSRRPSRGAVGAVRGSRCRRSRRSRRSFGVRRSCRSCGGALSEELESEAVGARRSCCRRSCRSCPRMLSELRGAASEESGGAVGAAEELESRTGVRGLVRGAVGVGGAGVRAVRGAFRRAHRGGFRRRRPRRRRHDDDDEYEPAQSGCQDRDPEGVGERPGTQRSSDARHLPTHVQQAGDSIADCLAVSTTRGIEMIVEGPDRVGPRSPWWSNHDVPDAPLSTNLPPTQVCVSRHTPSRPSRAADGCRRA